MYVYREKYLLLFDQLSGNGKQRKRKLNVKGETRIQKSDWGLWIELIKDTSCSIEKFYYDVLEMVSFFLFPLIWLTEGTDSDIETEAND